MKESQLVALSELLCSAFSPDEFKRFVYQLDDGSTLWQSIPTEHVSPRTTSFEFVLALNRRNGVDDGLFRALFERRSGWADRISEIYEGMFDRRFVQDLTEGSGQEQDLRGKCDDDVVALLGCCAASTRAESFDVINTTEVFRSYAHVQPWIRVAWGDVFPGPAKDPDANEDPFASGFGFSKCVGISLRGIASHTPQAERMSVHDLFFDLARFGAGRSVSRLRAAGVSIEKINGWSRSLHIGLRTRHGELRDGRT